VKSKRSKEALTKEALTQALGKLSLLRHFPTSPHALVALSEILQEICTDDKDLALLVREMLEGFDQWPGPRAMREAHIPPYTPYIRA
jgi:hypothetical protein